MRITHLFAVLGDPRIDRHRRIIPEDLLEGIRGAQQMQLELRGLFEEADADPSIGIRNDTAAHDLLSIRPLAELNGPFVSTPPKIAPARAIAFLSYPVPSFFADDKSLRRDCLRLYAQGVERIGHLVRLTRFEAFLWLDRNEEKYKSMTRKLEPIGLDFNMRAIGWPDAVRRVLDDRAQRPLTGPPKRIGCVLLKVAECRQALC